MQMRKSTILLWCCVVLGIYFLSAAFIYIAFPDTEKRGQFGDLFGAINTLFSALALAGVILTYIYQHRSNAESAVESRFFQLLGILQMNLNEVRVGPSVGRQATRKLSDWLLDWLMPCRDLTQDLSDDDRLADIRKWFQHFYDGTACERARQTPQAPAVDLLGHIFRSTYHILKYVNASKAIGASEKQAYASLLRAHLSNPELVMLFYNCLTGHGFEKHFPLLAGYRMFANMNRLSLVDPENDWQLYLNLIERRKPEIKRLVGSVPATQTD